jgi:hypothetical protein
VTGLPALAAPVERRLLERALRREPGELGHLDRLPVATLRDLREQVERGLRLAGDDVFGNLLAASRLLPDALVARVAQRALTPMMCAQLAGLLEPHRARSLVRHLDASYVAELAGHVDPSTIAHLVPHLPRPLVVEVASTVLASGDGLTAARLVVLLPDEVVVEVLARVDHDTMLLEVLLTAPGDHDRLVSLVPSGRLEGCVRAAGDAAVVARLLQLAALVGGGQQVRLAAAVVAADDGARARFAAVAAAHDLPPLG